MFSWRCLVLSVQLGVWGFHKHLTKIFAWNTVAWEFRAKEFCTFWATLYSPVFSLRDPYVYQTSSAFKRMVFTLFLSSSCSILVLLRAREDIGLAKQWPVFWGKVQRCFLRGAFSRHFTLCLSILATAPSELDLLTFQSRISFWTVLSFYYSETIKKLIFLNTFCPYPR